MLSLFQKIYSRKLPFDEVYGSKEDRYWVKDMIERKNNFLYDPSLIINHFYTKMEQLGKELGNMSNYYKHDSSIVSVSAVIET